MLNNNERKKKLRRSLLTALLFIGLIALTFRCLLGGRDLGAIMSIAYNANLWYLAAAFLSVFSLIFCNGWCIRVLFKALGSKVSVPRFLYYSIVEFFFSSVTPANTGGQPMQAMAMSRDGYDISESVIILVSLSIYSKVSLVLLFVAALVLNFGFMAKHIAEIPVIFSLGLALTVGIIFFSFFVLLNKRCSYPIIGGIFDFLAKFKVFRRVAAKKEAALGKVAEYHKCSGFINAHPSAAVKAFFIVVLQRLSLLAVGYFVFLALGVEPKELLNIFSLQILIAVSVDMLPLPGGVGASEAVSLVLYEEAFSRALMFPAMLLCRGINYYFVLVFSGLALLVVNGIKRLRSRKKSVKEDKL